jgi:flavin-dependent dehydrogenase
MKDIVIVGGGAAGWMTAKYLSVKQPDINITLIESPTVPRIGVGESMTPYLMRFFKAVGIEKDSDWMPHCNATYKNGVIYDNWDKIGSRYWHAFEVDEGIYPYWNIKREKENLDISDYWKSTMYTGHIAMEDSNKWLADKNGVVPEYYHKEVYNGWPQVWAYHIDANKFADFLKNITLEHINYVSADIKQIETNDNGILKLIDNNEKEYTADLFVDCSGFKKLLISEVNDNFTSFKPYLTLDKAIGMPLPYDNQEEQMKPRTKCTALSSGWAWEVPLYNRIGNGYVYSSKHISDEDALQELKQHVGLDRCKDAKTFTVDIESGFYTEPWKKNVVAVGLSSGFIEPMEATSMFLAQLSSIRIDHVIKGEFTVEEYNDEVQINIKDFMDFISTGYAMSRRDDSEFWRDQKFDMMSDKMKEWLSAAKKKIQPPEQKELFVRSSWISKLIGSKYFPDNAMFDGYNEKDAKEAEKFMQKMKSFDVNTRITHKEYLDKFVYS